MSQHELCAVCRNTGREACKFSGLSFNEINSILAKDHYAGIDCPELDEHYTKALEGELDETEPQNPVYSSDNFPHLIPEPRDTAQPQLGLNHPDSTEETIQWLALRDRDEPSVIHEEFNIPDFLRNSALPTRFHAVFHRVIATRGDYPKEMNPLQKAAFVLWSEKIKIKRGIGSEESAIRREFDWLENIVVNTWINQSPDGDDMITIYERR